MTEKHFDSKPWTVGSESSISQIFCLPNIGKGKFPECIGHQDLQGFLRFCCKEIVESWACCNGETLFYYWWRFILMTLFHSGNSRWLEIVLPQNAGELAKKWVSVLSRWMQQKYIDKKKKKYNASIPALLFSPLGRIRSRSPVFLVLHLCYTF